MNRAGVIVNPVAGSGRAVRAAAAIRAAVRAAGVEMVTSRGPGGDPAPVHIDGEPFATLPLEVEVEVGAVRVAVPLRIGYGGAMTVTEPRVGARVVGARGRRIGTVDAVFVDYLLVRTRGMLPVDLYIPRAELTVRDDGRIALETDAETAYRRWHRPLRSAPHD